MNDTLSSRAKLDVEVMRRLDLTDNEIIYLSRRVSDIEQKVSQEVIIGQHTLGNFVRKFQADFLTELEQQTSWGKNQLRDKFLVILANTLASTT